MRLAVALARHGILAPTKEKVEVFLEYLAEALVNEDISGFDALRRKLPLMATVHGFFVDVVPLVSPCLHSENRDMVLAALDTIEVIVSKYGKKLSTFSLTRLLNDLLLFHKADDMTYNLAKNLFFKMIEVNHNYTLYPLERLMAVCDEGLQLEIIVLLLEHVMNTKKVNRVVVTDGCRIALEGLFYPSSQIRLAAFDLVYALYYRGTPKDVLVKFFVKRKAPEELLDAIRARLQRRYKPPLVLDSDQLGYPSSDIDFVWAENTTLSSEYQI